MSSDFTRMLGEKGFTYMPQVHLERKPRDYRDYTLELGRNPDFKPGLGLLPTSKLYVDLRYVASIKPYGDGWSSILMCGSGSWDAVQMPYERLVTHWLLAKDNP